MDAAEVVPDYIKRDHVGYAPELRKARSRSQEEIAAALTVGQPAVAKLERRTDMHVSNLRRYVEALGGTLVITARFPDASVVLTNIGEGTHAS